jgi:glycosyltransferase involved in cell wall biosynthesis
MSIFFSIIVPTYHRPKLCLEAINSILSQSYNNFEIILVCHGKENYIPYLKENINTNQNLIKFYYIKDKYLSEARNHGVKNSSGEWLAFLDDDDLWDREKLKIFADHILNNYGLDILYSDFETYDLLNHKYQSSSLAKYFDYHRDLITALQYSNFVSGGSAAVIKKKSLLKIGMFDESLGGCEDHDLWRRAINNRFIFFFINKKLTTYRKGNSNLGTNTFNQKKFELLHFDKIQKELPIFLLNEKENIISYFFIRFNFTFEKNISIQKIIKFNLKHFSKKIIIKQCLNILKKKLFFFIKRSFGFFIKIKQYTFSIHLIKIFLRFIISPESYDKLKNFYQKNIKQKK